MKILYLANIRLPSEKAHTKQIMKMCEAFAREKVYVELLVPRRRNPGFQNQDPFEYYGVEKIFKIKDIFCIDFVGRFFWHIGFIIESLSFFIAALPAILKSSADIVYSRDDYIVFFLSFFKNNLIIEEHRFPSAFFLKTIYKRTKGIVALNGKIKQLFTEYGAELNRIIACHDAVDMNDFNISQNKDDLRQQFNLPQNKKIILYAGHLFRWKGVYALADASKYLDDNSLVVFIGGTEEDKTEFSQYVRNKKLRNILILGHKDPPQVPKYLKSADILVLPNSANFNISKHYTSPMKLFEYMASRKPIVASDLPSLREVLDAKCAVLVEPDSPAALASAISGLLQNTARAQEIARNAYEKVSDFTWDKRAKKITHFIKTLLK